MRWVDDREMCGNEKAYKEEIEWLEIDYGRIARALEFYQALGYKKVEVPWIVEPKYREITYPHVNSFQTPHGDIVGSAEQSFLKLAFETKIQIKNYFWNQGDQPAGRYVAVTPCFRDNQPEDKLHQKYFMKVELFEPIFYGTSYKDLKPVKLFYDAGQFFASEGALPEREATDEGIDWTVGGVEVGSYGYRTHEGFGWLYGTGLAEPRFSQALTLQKQHMADKFKTD